MATAACLCLVLGTVTVLAAPGLRTRIIELFTSRTQPGSDFIESGYDLLVDVEKIPVSALKGEIQEVPAILVRQYQTYQPYSSWHPGSYQRSFSSSAEVLDYIGFDALRGLDWEFKEQDSILRVTGNAEGKLLHVETETRYRVGNIRLQAFSTLFTEHKPEAPTLGSRTTEAVAFSESYHETKSGLSYHTLSSTVLQSGYLMLAGYLVSDGVLYQLHIAYLENDSEQAEALLHRWAGLF